VSTVVTPFKSLFGLSVGGPGVLYAATDAGLMKSTDGGAIGSASGRPGRAHPTVKLMSIRAIRG
jgi:hypothetical protein